MKKVSEILKEANDELHKSRISITGKSNAKRVTKGHKSSKSGHLKARGKSSNRKSSNSNRRDISIGINQSSRVKKGEVIVKPHLKSGSTSVNIDLKHHYNRIVNNLKASTDKYDELIYILWDNNWEITEKEVAKMDKSFEEYKSTLDLVKEWQKVNKIKDKHRSLNNFDLFIDRYKSLQKLFKKAGKVVVTISISDKDYANLSLKDKILSFKNLEDGWNGYDASSMQEKAVDNGLRFFNKHIEYSPCFVHPSIDGYVGVDFKNVKKKLRIRVVVISSRRLHLVILKNKKEVVENEVVNWGEFKNYYSKYLGNV